MRSFGRHDFSAHVVSSDDVARRDDAFSINASFILLIDF